MEFQQFLDAYTIFCKELLMQNGRNLSKEELFELHRVLHLLDVEKAHKHYLTSYLSTLK